MLIIRNEQFQALSRHYFEFFIDDMAERLLAARPEHFTGLDRAAGRNRVQQIATIGHEKGFRSAAALGLFVEHIMNDIGTPPTLSRAVIDLGEDVTFRRLSNARNRAESLE